MERVELNHPGLRKGSVLVEIAEVDQRQNHISQVDPNHSLLPIVLDCLKDEGSERPSAHQLCERVADLKGMPKYRDSAKTVQDKDEVIQQLRQLQQGRDQTNRQLEREVGQVNQLVRQLQLERDQILQEKAIQIAQLEEKERQLGRVRQQLEGSEQAVAQFERQISELEQ